MSNKLLVPTVLIIVYILIGATENELISYKSTSSVADYVDEKLWPLIFIVSIAISLWGSSTQYKARYPIWRAGVFFFLYMIVFLPINYAVIQGYVSKINRKFGMQDLIRVDGIITKIDIQSNNFNALYSFTIEDNQLKKPLRLTVPRKVGERAKINQRFTKDMYKGCLGFIYSD